VPSISTSTSTPLDEAIDSLDADVDPLDAGRGPGHRMGLSPSVGLARQKKLRECMHALRAPLLNMTTTCGK